MMPKLLGEEVASTPAVTICINHLPDPEKGNSSLKSIRNFIVTYQKKVKHVAGRGSWKNSTPARKIACDKSGCGSS